MKTLRAAISASLHHPRFPTLLALDVMFWFGLVLLFTAPTPHLFLTGCVLTFLSGLLFVERV